MPRHLIYSGTGSRSLATAPELHQFRVYQFTRAALIAADPERVIAGGAEGFDHALAMVAYSLSIPVTLAIPSRDYGPYYWTARSVTKRDRTEDWDEMIGLAADVVYISAWHMYGRANFIRNQWMVDEGDEFLVYRPLSRGTADCLGRIKAQKKPWTEVLVQEGEE